MSSRSSPRGNRRLASTFITEMDSFSHANNSNRSSRRNNSNSTMRKKSNLPRISGSQSMFTTTFGRADPNAPLEFDQGKLDHAYELLVKEIMDLKTDIAPIRHTYLKLKDRLLFQRQCSVNSNENFLLSEQFPDLSRAIGEGGTFSGLIEEFQIEIDDNTNVINELKNRFSSYWTVKLSCENDKDRDELSAMKEFLNNLKLMKKKYTEDLMKIKQSENIQKIDNQKKKMHKLILDVGKAEQRNEKLQKTLQLLEKEFDLDTPSSSILTPPNTPTEPSTNKVKFILGDTNTDTNTNKNNTNKTNTTATTNNNKPKYHIDFLNTPEAQAAFDEVESLEKELAQKKKAYLLKCDQLIVIRNQQLSQLQEIEKKRQEKLKELEIEEKKTKEIKKFHVKEPKKPPTSTGRSRKSVNSPASSRKSKKDSDSLSKTSLNNENVENKANKMSNEELISHLMSGSEKSKRIEEELQEIPIEDESSNEEDAAGIQIEDST